MKTSFFKTAALSLSLITLSYVAPAQEKQQQKIDDAVTVVGDFSKMSESIPKELMNMAQGIIIVPKLVNAGFVVGGKRGRGIAMTKMANGSWSDPVFVTLTGGSFGLQAGVQSVDLLLVFKHRNTLENIGNGDFTLGGDISAAAGPVGRSSSANTNYKFDAEVYSYSRSKGLFAGISLDGTDISVDKDGIKAYYSQDITAKTLFSGTSKAASADKLKKGVAAL
ncbi:hypothetical protein GS399_16505 [Pedobacter sp. HMF7647]|uniref:Ysc84 actin-binding domain-containing protein n=2 Tax=Hufsiella arboris TaxID=2695275 RepID=A0A7K1YDA5_9SPHI|nr:hypothetical protein [Hufsiella arboris]